MKKFAVKEAVIAAAIFFVCCLIFMSGALKPLDNMLTDRLYQSPRAIENDIKIIAIDEKTLAALGPFGSWDRQIYADLIQRLMQKQAKPAAIGFDIMMFGDIAADGDAAFAKSAEQHGNVCVASHIVFGEELMVGQNGAAYLDNLKPKMLETPYPALDAAAVSGFANMGADSDGIVRKSTLSVDFEGETLYNFAAACYMAYARQLGITPVMPGVDSYGRWNIPFAGYPGDFEAVSLIDVLDGSIDPRLFDGCMVLVGAYAPGLQDAYYVPIDKAEQMYGVEIHANIIQAMLDGMYVLSADPFITAIIYSLAAALLYIAFRRIKKAWLSALLLAGTISANILIGILLYRSGYVINLVYLPLAAIAIYIVTLVLGYINESAQRKRVTNAFKKYVAPQVVEEIVKEGRYDIELGGENKDIAVMFVDIRGFTPMSERLAPEEVVEVLNSYLNLTTEAIFKNSGTLDKFIGDATMAIFNAPFDLEDYVFKAAQTALDIVSGAKELEERLYKNHGERVAFGIGLNCGEAIVGNIGCKIRMDYTAIGDTVNTAARLESKAAPSQILMSEAFYSIIKERVMAREVGAIPLKGKSREILIYELLGFTEDE